MALFFLCWEKEGHKTKGKKTKNKNYIYIRIREVDLPMLGPAGSAYLSLLE